MPGVLVEQASMSQESERGSAMPTPERQTGSTGDTGGWETQGNIRENTGADSRRFLKRLPLIFNALFYFSSRASLGLELPVDSSILNLGCQ